MVGARGDVLDPLALELLLEFRRSVPALVLPPVVGQDLLRPPVDGNRPLQDLDHQLPRLPGVESPPHQVPRVVVHEADEVDPQPPDDGEGGDVALPELVGAGAFEEVRLVGGTFAAARRRLEEVFLPQRRVRLPVRNGQKQRPSQPGHHPAGAEVGVLLLHRQDVPPEFRLLRPRAAILRPPPPSAFRQQGPFAPLLVHLLPRIKGRVAYPVHLRHLGGGKISLQRRLDDLDLVRPFVPNGPRPAFSRLRTAGFGAHAPSHTASLLPHQGLREARKV